MSSAMRSWSSWTSLGTSPSGTVTEPRALVISAASPTSPRETPAALALATSAVARTLNWAMVSTPSRFSAHSPVTALRVRSASRRDATCVCSTVHRLIDERRSLGT